MHPVEDIKGTLSTTLHGTRILLGVTGSIAAIDTIHIARDLIRHDADVIPVMTPAATHIIHPDALEFATGHTPITHLTGQVEHVQLCGIVTDPIHLVLLPACTANTISKIAHGIDDTPVTTCVTTALGSHIPILLIPAMHGSMYTNTIVQHNIQTCRNTGIHILEPRTDRTKARPPDRPTITATVTRLLTPQTYHDTRLLIIGGATAEPIDDIRILTNRSSGKIAVALAQTAYEHGATIDLWYGNATEPVPPYITHTPFTTTHDLLTLIKKTRPNTYHGIIVCAAIANYIPHPTPGKIPSGKHTLILTCHPAPNILEALRKKAPTTPIIAFKAETTKANLRRKTQALITHHHLQGAVGNTLTAFGARNTEILILTPKGKALWKTGTKPELAKEILKMFKPTLT